MDARKEIINILQNHETDTVVLQRQLDYERRQLQLDLEEIYSAVGIKGIRYDLDKVQSSPNADEALASAIARAMDRRDEYAKKSTRIESRLNAIKAVYSEVLALEYSLSLTLQALYYPRSSYRNAAIIMGVDLKTVERRRERALDQLIENCKEHKVFL